MQRKGGKYAIPTSEEAPAHGVTVKPSIEFMRLHSSVPKADAGLQPQTQARRSLEVGNKPHLSIPLVKFFKNADTFTFC